MRHLYFAQGYGCSDYSETIAYNSCVPLDGSDTSTSRSDLANTGIAVLGILTLACVLIFLGILIRFVRRPKKADDEDNNKTGNKPKKAV